MMTAEELAEYFHVPQHERDRETFRRDQIAEARNILAGIPSPEIDLKESA